MKKLKTFYEHTKLILKYGEWRIDFLLFGNENPDFGFTYHYYDGNHLVLNLKLFCISVWY